MLSRPSGPQCPFATNVMVTITAACQMITAAAHADAYPSISARDSARRSLIAADYYTG